jgi:hypothetical protein
MKYFTLHQMKDRGGFIFGVFHPDPGSFFAGQII